MRGWGDGGMGGGVEGWVWDGAGADWLWVVILVGATGCIENRGLT